MTPMTDANGKQYPTRIDLLPEQKTDLITLLNQQLANTLDLQSQTKHAHWNVKGSNFYGLHKLFDDLSEMVEKDVDLIAERLTALGGVAQGTVRMAASASDLDEFPGDLTASLDVVDHMGKVFGQAANSARDGIERADDLEDAVTSDLLTDVARDLDRAVYFIDSHLQK